MIFMDKKLVFYDFKQKNKISINEFSKLMVVLIFILLVIWVSLSFVLSFFDKNVNEGVTVALISCFGGSLIGYFGQNAFCKNSRNKHGIDENGNLISNNNKENN